MIAGAAVLLMGLGYLAWGRIENFVAASEVESLTEKSKSLDRKIEAAKKDRAKVADIARWANDEVIWLDQLYSLNQCFPPKEDAVLDELVCSQQGMDVKGLVSNEGVLAKMEESMDKRIGPVTPKIQKEDQSRRPYSWHFEALVVPKKASETSAAAAKEQAESPAATKKVPTPPATPPKKEEEKEKEKQTEKSAPAKQEPKS